MLLAANLAGKAINLTQTTAGHAMAYKLTTLYGMAHGHAVALCIEKLWPYMVRHTEDCMDKRGTAYLNEMFRKLADVMDCDSPEAAAKLMDGFSGSFLWNAQPFSIRKSWRYWQDPSIRYV